MLYTKIDKKGIDTNIDGMQNFLYPKLVALWGLDPTSAFDYNSYARAYRNQTQDGYVPEVFVGTKDYKEVFQDDRIKCISFFGVGENIQFVGNQFVADVHLCFAADITKLNASAERPDEIIRQQIVKLVQGIKLFGFEFKGIETGIDNVFKEYPGIRKSSGIKFSDMHPNHCFRLNFNVKYKINC